MSTKKDLKQHYLDRTSKMPDNTGGNLDRNIRVMRKNAHEKFDKIWVKYNNDRANFDECKLALEKWLKLELI